MCVCVCVGGGIIQAAPLDSNILEWHYVITGTKGSPYEGGHYHGKLKFPPEVRWEYMACYRDRESEDPRAITRVGQ